MCVVCFMFKLRPSNNLATLRLDNKYLDPPDRSTPVENEIENEQRIKSKCINKTLQSSLKKMHASCVVASIMVLCGSSIYLVIKTT